MNDTYQTHECLLKNMMFVYTSCIIMLQPRALLFLYTTDFSPPQVNNARHTQHFFVHSTHYTHSREHRVSFPQLTPPHPLLFTRPSFKNSIVVAVTFHHFRSKHPDWLHISKTKANINKKNNTKEREKKRVHIH